MDVKQVVHVSAAVDSVPVMKDRRERVWVDWINHIYLFVQAQQSK